MLAKQSGALHNWVVEPQQQSDRMIEPPGRSCGTAAIPRNFRGGTVQDK